MKIKFSFLFTFLFLSLGRISFSQSVGYPVELFSRAEITNYTETSLNQDVINFVNTLSKNCPNAHLEIIGNTKSGNPLALIILANSSVSTPEEAKQSGKPIIYIQGNIHAGEVEGKEACMELMREIALGSKKFLLDSQIIIFCPNFNPDGNDKLSATNRSSQDGSPKLTGQRSSSEGFDLNRDGMKLEAIEYKLLMKNVLFKWDPALFVDLHTDNGSWHGYALNYAPAYLSAGQTITTNYTTDSIFTAVQSKVLERSGIPMFLHGYLSNRPNEQVKFSAYSHLPRYIVNSMGLRNRLGILCETFAHDKFEKRILSTKMFVLSLLEYTNTHATELKEIIRKAENETINEITSNSGNLKKGVKYQIATSNKPFDILTRETVPYTDDKGRQRQKPTGRLVYLPNCINYDHFEPTKTSKVPRGYVFPSELKNVAEKLIEHGINVEILSKKIKFEGEEFLIKTFKQDTKEAYGGHKAITIDGEFKSNSKSFPKGSYFVDLAQPLAWLAFYLLEPESDDGLTFWNFFDDYLIKNGVEKGNIAHPVFKYFIKADKK